MSSGRRRNGRIVCKFFESQSGKDARRTHEVSNTIEVMELKVSA